MDWHKHISPIPYISHAYGDLLTHERNDHKLDNNLHRVHADITVGFHNNRRSKQYLKFNLNQSLYNPELTNINLSLYIYSGDHDGIVIDLEELDHMDISGKQFFPPDPFFAVLNCFDDALIVFCLPLHESCSFLRGHSGTVTPDSTDGR